MMWPTKDIPPDYLKVARRLVNQDVVTEREFVDLCMLAIKYINSGGVALHSRSSMAMYIANIWLNHSNIRDVSLLSDIGGQFGEWEIPGSFIIDDEAHKHYWDKTQRLVDEADKKYPAENK